jgi:putative ABC transport system permease protein
MNPVSRGIRNAFRNQIRTFSIVLILGLSIGLALSMLVARQAVQTKIESVKSSIGNTVSISPAGAQGFQGGGEPLTTDQLKPISTIPNVTNVTESLSDRFTAENTTLVSAIEAGSLGRRQAGNSGVEFVAPPEGITRNNTGTGSATQITRTFTPPVVATGVSSTSSASIYGGSTVTFTSGQAIDASKDINEAVVGKALATKNNLVVGSTFTAYGSTIKVVGIYDTGTTFSNAGLVFSLASLQRLSSQPGAVTSATATVNSIDNVDTATTAIKASLGDKADVTNNQETAKTAVAPLESVKKIATFSLIGALLAGAVIILLTMIMIVRERRREIGVMKAIGASNAKTVFQFMSEAITLTILGMIVGLVIGVAGASPITKVLVTNSESSSTTAQQGPGQGIRGGLRQFGNNGVTSIRNVETSVGPQIIAEGIAAALIIAIIGSAIPAFLISKVRPAEVMRAE